MSSRCGVCGAETAVKDSRPTAGGLGVIRRRRICLNGQCGERFTTLEFSAHDLERLIAARVAQRLQQVRDVVRVVNEAISGVPVKRAGRVTETLFAPDLVAELEMLNAPKLDDRARLERYKDRQGQDPVSDLDV